MENPKKLIYYSSVYGLLIGTISAVFELLIFIFGKLNDNMISLITMFIFVFGVSLAIRHYRDTINNGLIDFRNAFKIGFQVSFFTAVVGAIFSYIKFKYLSPHLVDQIHALAKEMYITKDISEKETELRTLILDKCMTPGYLSFIFIINRCFWGSILSFLLGFTMKREKSPKRSDNSGFEL
jgi:hypothetical protein